MAEKKAPADTPPGDGKRVAKLSRPLVVMGKPVEELSFREPTAEDIERYGFPLIIEDDDTDPAVVDVTRPQAPAVRFEEKKMTAQMAVLSNVPIADIRRMAPRDWLTCAWAVAVFFLA